MQEHPGYSGSTKTPTNETEISKIRYFVPNMAKLLAYPWISDEFQTTLVTPVSGNDHEAVVGYGYVPRC